MDSFGSRPQLYLLSAAVFENNISYERQIN